jgi:Skp family chaperone for outer membrane proteins
MMGEGLKIAVMDFEGALKKHPRYLDEAKNLALEHQNSMKKVRELQLELEDMEAKLKGLSIQKRASLEMEIEQKKQAFTVAYESATSSTAKRQKEASLAVYKELQFQVERYRDKHGIDLVLNKKPLARETKQGIQIDPYASIIASSQSLDITNDVIKAIEVADKLGELIKGKGKN